MEISKDTKAIVEVLNEFSENKLRKKNDLECILEICASNSMDLLANELIFNGKSLSQIYATLKQQTSDTDLVNNLKQEYENTLIKFVELVHKVSSKFSDPKIKERFEGIYFQNSVGSQMNILDLAHDFAFLKELQNQAKRNLN